MIHEALKQFKTALFLLIVLSILTGLLYPAIMTALAQLIFPFKANGSFIKQNGKTMGSLLISQAYTNPKYFLGRNSATTPFPYNAANSSGSNFGPSNQKFLASLNNNIIKLQELDPQNRLSIPVDLVTSSASGIDPEISPLAAYYQTHRIADLRGLPESELQLLVQRYIKKRTFGILGEPRVNILELNIALDKLTF
jgi:potassium-transporting ATPase KdpC subunit